MAHYIAIIEDAGPDTAAGVWFPDLPGCFSAGDDIDQAMRNAPEALELYAEAIRQQGKQMPRPRSLMELRDDPDVAGDIDSNIVALIELRASAQAAE
jgi:predicted RNase H-like HicB family nuclease